MRVLASLYRYTTTIGSDGKPTKTREFVTQFPALMLPVSTNERVSLFGIVGVVDYRLYPLVPVEIRTADEIDINSETYQIVSVTPSQTRYVTSSVLLRRGETQ